MLKDRVKRWIEPVRTEIRSRNQEREAARVQAHYEAEAARRGLQPESGDALVHALRERLASRSHPTWPKRKGELHIFHPCEVYNWEMVLPDTLAPFGRVTAFDWEQQGFHREKPNWLERRDAMNQVMLEAFEAAWREQPVDAVVGYLSGFNTAPETLEKMAARGSAIFNFCWDDKLRFPSRMLGGRYASPAAIAHAIDLNLTNAPSSIVKYAVHGGLALFCPQGAHPPLHRPHDTPFEFDVSFVGGRYGWRPRFIRRLDGLLANDGVRVACFGPRWQNGALSDEEMVRLYSRSRINLGFGAVADTRNLLCIKGRDFEVPMSGGLYLTQNNPELPLVFDVGREIAVYRDEADCARVIRELLAEPERAASIREAGRERCLREHTWEARWEQALGLAGILDPGSSDAPAPGSV